MMTSLLRCVESSQWGDGVRLLIVSEQNDGG